MSDGPTSYDDIKPMRIEKAIRIMNKRIVWLEDRIEQHQREEKPIGHFLAEMSAIKALIAASSVRP